jgi:hypothetical protein
MKEAFSSEVAKPVDAVTGIIRVILWSWVNARGRNRKWFRAGRTAG